MKSVGAIDDASSMLVLETRLSDGSPVVGCDLINQKPNKGKGQGGR